MVVLGCDVVRFYLRAISLVFLFNHHRCGTGSSRCMTENVTYVVVTKHQRSAMVTAGSVVTKDVHFSCTRFASLLSLGMETVR